MQPERYHIASRRCQARIWSEDQKLQPLFVITRNVQGVRRGKAALSSRCKSHPATAPAGSNRSSHGGDEVAEAFGDRQRPLVERFGLGVAALISVEPSQIVQRPRDIGMIGPESLLADRQRALEERL